MRLADLKRIPVGTQLRLVECLTGAVPEEKQLRTIEKVQSNAWASRVAHSGKLSWLTFPRAANFRETPDGFAVYEGSTVAARYVWVKQ